MTMLSVFLSVYGDEGKKTMKRFLIFSLLFIAACAGETSKNGKLFIGKWLEETTPSRRFVQGIELKPDGTAASIGMATLKYEKWTTDGSRLIVSGKSIGNRQTIDFSDEWRVIAINPQTMQIEQSNGYRINYYRMEKTR